MTSIDLRGPNPAPLWHVAVLLAFLPDVQLVMRLLQATMLIKSCIQRVKSRTPGAEVTRNLLRGVDNASAAIARVAYAIVTLASIRASYDNHNENPVQ
jgi:hypothetical protein